MVREDENREIRIIIPKGMMSLGIPEEAKSHFQKAVREGLMAIRSLIDARIQLVEKASKERPTKSRIRKIRIE